MRGGVYTRLVVTTVTISEYGEGEGGRRRERESREWEREKVGIDVTIYMYMHITSVMIYHRGASLSEQHTYSLTCHCTKQDLSQTSRYVDKSSGIV